MVRALKLICVGLGCIQAVASFQTAAWNNYCAHQRQNANDFLLCMSMDGESSNTVGRKQFLSQFLSIAAAAALATPNRVSAEESSPEGIPVFKTGSGLKYFDLKPGTGPTPRYGQLVSIQYTGYMKLPTESKPQQFDSNTFLIKHGNGRIIAGLDEGIHTMKVGGKRRIIIPPKLGYVESGLGPIPELPWNRWSLNRLLNQMIEQRGGNLVFEVELISAMDDEADQGYYEDLSPTPEEFEKLRVNFQERSAAAAVAREAAENSNL